jgi:hypothetical protein
MQIVKRLLLLLVLGSVLAAALASSAAARPVWGSNGCGTSEWRPTVVAFACADGKLLFETEDWSVWGSDEATAAGYLKHPDVDDPSCANLPISACPWVESEATIRLWAPSYCSSNGRWQFLRLRVDAPEDIDPEVRKITRHFKCREYAKPHPARHHRHRHSYWKDCGYPASYALKTVIAHRVNCTKAKRLIRKVWRVGQEGGPTSVLHVKSFDCTLGGGNRPISCENGPHKVRGPLPG